MTVVAALLSPPAIPFLIPTTSPVGSLSRNCSNAALTPDPSPYQLTRTAIAPMMMAAITTIAPNPIKVMMKERKLFKLCGWKTAKKIITKRKSRSVTREKTSPEFMSIFMVRKKINKGIERVILMN